MTLLKNNNCLSNDFIHEDCRKSYNVVANNNTQYVLKNQLFNQINIGFNNA